MNVRLGYAVGTGEPVDIPLAHTFVTGQTQLSGKTTTLRALVERSQQRALAFVTKRGESFEGRRIRPYLPREGDRQIPWRLVETIMAASLGQRNMKWERGAIVTASKGATTLQQVRDNVRRLQTTTKNFKNEELYMLLGEYLDLVLPEMRSLNAAAALDLQPGLNVMDLTDVGQQTQAMVIRAALEHINQHERGVLTVFPEAWEFAPRGRSAPAKDEAIAMARKGAVLGNYLLCDSQDIAGVETVVRQAASVWILGVQRELNELKRTLQMIPAGIKKPKPEDVSTLELGQFWACWGRHAIRTYVQPAWMADEIAINVARGVVTVGQVVRQQAGIAHEAKQIARRFGVPKEETVNAAEAEALRNENRELRRENNDFRRRIAALEQHAGASTEHADVAPSNRGRAAVPERPAAPQPPSLEGTSEPRAFTPEETFDNERLYQAFKARLIEEAVANPVLLKVLRTRPELEVSVRRQTIEADGASLRGRLAQLIAEGWFNEPRNANQARIEMGRRGRNFDPKGVYRECDNLAELGFLRKETSGYQAVSNMKVNIIEAA